MAYRTYKIHFVDGPENGRSQIVHYFPKTITFSGAVQPPSGPDGAFIIIPEPKTHTYEFFVCDQFEAIYQYQEEKKLGYNTYVLGKDYIISKDIMLYKDIEDKWPSKEKWKYAPEPDIFNSGNPGKYTYSPEPPFIKPDIFNPAAEPIPGTPGSYKYEYKFLTPSGWQPATPLPPAVKGCQCASCTKMRREDEERAKLEKIKEESRLLEAKLIEIEPKLMLPEAKPYSVSVDIPLIKEAKNGEEKEEFIF